MVTIPIPRSGKDAQMRETHIHELGTGRVSTPASEANPHDRTNWLAAGAVVAGAALMVTGNRRAGLAVAAAGTASALIEEQEAVSRVWKNLPDYLNQAHDLLEKVERYIGEATSHGERIQRILRR